MRVLPEMTGLSLPDEAGHFMLILQRATVPRFASDNRMSGTAEENRPSTIMHTLLHDQG